MIEKGELEKRLKDAERVAGLRQHLETVREYAPSDCWYAEPGDCSSGELTGSSHLVDLQIKPDENAAAYIVQTQQWDKFATRGGVEYSVEIGAFRKGQCRTSGHIVFTGHGYYDKFKPWKRFHEIKGFEVLEDKIKIVAGAFQGEQEFEFEL
jgi:hypothetical protein